MTSTANGTTRSTPTRQHHQATRPNPAKLNNHGHLAPHPDTPVAVVHNAHGRPQCAGRLDATSLPAVRVTGMTTDTAQHANSDEGRGSDLPTLRVCLLYT